MNGQRGFGYVEIAVVIAVAVALAFTVSWIYASGAAAGTAKERAAWQKRELAQQQSYAADIEKLRKAKDAELAELQGKLARAGTDYEDKRKEAEHAKAKNAGFERALRDGRIVLVDPGAPGAGQAGGSPGTTGATTAGGCDGTQKPQPRGLSGELSASLWAEAARADGLIIDLVDQLELAQNATRAYYELAKACHEDGPSQNRQTLAPVNAATAR